ncbi:hypothetical protein PPSIR1_31068 [Plesiocystis pacifica SIR-1]|uniref:Nucleotidyltransferase n=1 Tax=Plesiocystis pacifica SIR-1 TaxID=391625 RepID=A6GH09_9BACT|nr:nucleotidyltransferase domain-containing protein [Plesiocystis pacifica]EDM74841.1 hypothetical protein PPSIR1_31068 [Plesiocystis pacifica SIR-1]
MTDALTPDQRAATDQLFAEELPKRRVLLVSLAGAHAYGFASADSDVDLKGIWLAPTRRLLGLGSAPGAADRLEWLEVPRADGGEPAKVEVDYTVNELGQAVHGVLKGNGNMLERVFDRAPLHADPNFDLDGFRAHARACLSRRAHNHYRGFAYSQRKVVDAAIAAGEQPKAKKVLYVLRTAVTGVHLLETGEVNPDLGALWERYGFVEVPELIACKRGAELGQLPEAWTDARVVALMDRAFARLDQAREDSALPEAPEPEAAQAIDDWLVDQRIASI